jgi:hypothetical protein
VAFVAVFEFQVGTLKLGAGLGVIETILLQWDDVRLPALVFGVADGAIVGLVAVISLFCGDAGGDLRVAGEALGRGHFPRGHVAGRTVRLARLGDMDRAEGARHFLLTEPSADRGRECGIDRKPAKQYENAPEKTRFQS